MVIWAASAPRCLDHEWVGGCARCDVDASFRRFGEDRPCAQSLRAGTGSLNLLKSSSVPEVCKRREGIVAAWSIRSEVCGSPGC